MKRWVSEYHDDELIYLVEKANLTDRQIAKIMGFSLETIATHRRALLGLKTSYQSNTRGSMWDKPTKINKTAELKAMRSVKYD